MRAVQQRLWSCRGDYVIVYVVIAKCLDDLRGSVGCVYLPQSPALEDSQAHADPRPLLGVVVCSIHTLV